MMLKSEPSTSQTGLPGSWGAEMHYAKNLKYLVGCQWLTPIILATQEGDSTRIIVQSQPRQIVCETLS
jgi:hypothetical protein